MSLVESIHATYVHTRRVRVLREEISSLLPPNATVLDVGCGDGLFSKLVLEQRPDLQIRGIDVLVRDQTHIVVEAFDGLKIPEREKSVDAVMLIDVLHHTDDPMILLREATRVARTCVIIKDHSLDGVLAEQTLRFMDRVGNARHGVVLPYNYWPGQRWMAAFRELNLTVTTWNKGVKLYPPPLNWVFGRSLHFIARLDIDSQQKMSPPAQVRQSA